VLRGVDGHDMGAIEAAITQARAHAASGRGPTLICCRTVIGRGAPNKAGTEKVHGSPLGAEEVAATRKALGWTLPPFEIPQDVYAYWDGRARGAQQQSAWQARFDRYAAEYPDLAAELRRRMAGELPADFAEHARAFVQSTQDKAESIATRKASQQAIEAFAAVLPELLGGSADLTGSNFTDWPGVQAVRRGDRHLHAGRHINFGVREFNCRNWRNSAMGRSYPVRCNSA
jgi:transketolase